MEWFQQEIRLSPKSRGFHIITGEIEKQLPQLRKINIGLAHIFIMHTSASLTLNENASPDVRLDMESHFNKMVPENMPYYLHTFEGPDDMPAHIKASLLGNSLSLPIRDGSFLLGTWQGIYLCEHRDRASSRRIVVTLTGSTS